MQSHYLNTLDQEVLMDVINVILVLTEDDNRRRRLL
jgi:hypothetical protein